VILSESGMVSSMSRLLQPMNEYRFQRTLWAIERPHQRIHRNRNMMVRSRDILNICDVLGSEYDSLKDRRFSQGSAYQFRDTKPGSVWQKDFKRPRGPTGCFLRYCYMSSSTVALAADFMRFLGLVSLSSLIFGTSARLQSDLGSFEAILTSVRRVDFELGRVLFSGVIRKYPAVSAPSSGLIQTVIIRC
jgi:hypothetical protein